MSQHDYDIANDDGASFRADLNLALLAIVQNNSGTSAPSDTWPHMWWYDTTNNILKERNEADDAWLERFFDAGAVGQPGARKSCVLNGDLSVWQRGTSFASIANGAYHVDRFFYAEVGTFVHDVDQLTYAASAANVPTVAESNHLSAYSIEVDTTTADASIAAGDYSYIATRIEGYNFAPFAEQALTLTFWHKHSLIGTYCIALRNSDAGKSYVAEYSQAVSDTWEKTTINITASPSAGNWDYTTGRGLDLIFTFDCGSTFQGTVDTWNSANNFATSNQVNGSASIGNKFRFAQIQLELGSDASNFEYRDYASELLQCMRYYREDGEGLQGYNQSTTAINVALQFSPPMNGAPTVTLLDTSIQLSEQGSGKTSSGSAITSSVRKANGAFANIDGFTGLTANGAFVIFTQANFLAFAAEIS